MPAWTTGVLLSSGTLDKTLISLHLVFPVVEAEKCVRGKQFKIKHLQDLK